MAKKRKSTFEDARKKNESGTPDHLKKTKIGVPFKASSHNVILFRSDEFIWRLEEKNVTGS